MRLILCRLLHGFITKLFKQRLPLLLHAPVRIPRPRLASPQAPIAILPSHRTLPQLHVCVYMSSAAHRFAHNFTQRSHLPAALLASFVKKLSRLSLNAPPAAIIMVIPFTYNILKNHPALMVMIHRAEAVDDHSTGTRYSHRHQSFLYIFLRQLTPTRVFCRPFPQQRTQPQPNPRARQFALGTPLPHLALPRARVDDVQDILRGIHEAAVCDGGFPGPHI